MQNYLQLQNKLRRELSERWNQYYQVDGLAKQKGNNIRFTPTTALQGIMYNVTKELQDLEDVLTQKNTNENPAQQLARQKMIVNEKIPKLIEQHKQATKNGILGKEEAWKKLLKKFPELDVFVKKYGKVRANEAILYSLSPDIKDFDTNLAKANLAEEYASSELNDIVEFLVKQQNEIQEQKYQKDEDRRMANAINAYSDIQAIEDGPEEVEPVDGDEYKEDEYEDTDDVDTVAQRENKPKKKPSPKSVKPPPKAAPKRSNAGKTVYPSKTPADSDEERGLKKKRKGKDDDDNDDEDMEYEDMEYDEGQKNMKARVDRARAKERGFSTVAEMNRHDKLEKAKQEGFNSIEEMRKEQVKNRLFESAIPDYSKRKANMTQEELERRRETSRQYHAKKKKEKEQQKDDEELARLVSVGSQVVRQQAVNKIQNFVRDKLLSKNKVNKALGKGKKPEPMKHKPKHNNNYLQVDTTQQTHQPRHVTIQLPPGVQNH